MNKITVNLVQNRYEIHIGKGLLDSAAESLHELGFSGKAAIVTNTTVLPLYGEKLNRILTSAGFKCTLLDLPDGEEYKSLNSAGDLYTRLSDMGAERGTPVLALGGGVIGDLVGFAAATYMRGLPLIHVPTTLLALVDSSIGGKVAVNHGQLKNNVGTFYQPRLVIGDIATLNTLPEKELINGLAEVIKYGVISDKKLFVLLQNRLNDLKGLDSELLEEVIARCAAIKAEIVARDEKDTGLRNILNYGHTVGHGIETVSEFKIQHGSAVAIGMIAAARISHRMSVLPAADLNAITGLIQRAGLPTKISGLKIQKILEAMKHDKKKSDGKLKFILPRTIGEVFICDSVSAPLLEEVLTELYE